MKMETIVILVCYNGKWVTSKKMCKYEGGDSKGLIVPRTIKFAELLDRVHQIGNTNIREDKICLKFSVLVASNEWKHIKIEDDDDVNFFMKYNSEVTPSKLAPLLVSIEDKGLTNDVVHSMHITTDSSRMGHSSVAIVESNEVTWNNTNVTDLGGEVGTDFMDMIDFSEVEEMHGGDNGTERNEVSVYSAPPNLGCSNTAGQLPKMRLGGESEPTRQHYWSQMGEKNRYNAVGVKDEEAYLDSGFSRSDWNPKITVGQIFSSKKTLLTELRLTALRGHFEFKVQFSCTKRLLVVCSQRPCPWRVRASRIGEYSFVIVRCTTVHECDLRFVSDKHRQATAALVASSLKRKLKDCRTIYTPSDIMRDVKHNFGCTIHYSKAWKARELALLSIRGSRRRHIISFQLIAMNWSV
ncbi:NB-ARC domain-containing disease resistance protein [Prunus dulcis]|uniref:NB-ARC domain-containing disease resistance protein n=1 Tax=Prunus dulcis TaxID=3755 RepID=A0A4Y1RNS6_PRUDU|nr:NB-ARC domain-containing disease resistance protein [Prunus dulcis]